MAKKNRTELADQTDTAQADQIDGVTETDQFPDDYTNYVALQEIQLDESGDLLLPGDKFGMSAEQAADWLAAGMITIDTPDEPKPELSDVPAFRLNPPTEMLSELSHEELLAEAQRYHAVEKVFNEDSRAQAEKIAELQAELDALKAEPTYVVESGLSVEVRRSLSRADLSHFVPGDVVAVITMAPGWNLNALVDHVREGYCGEKHS